ncbi:MAG: basic amino acid ABC transporter substrate-binding protein [Thermotogae bacterium]|nr:basic amino acid ABC transporter substrate-binding protein [Thermotogota bacterium]
MPGNSRKNIPKPFGGVTVKRVSLFITLVLVFSLFAFGGILDTIKARGYLVMGTNATFPPFESFNTQNEVVGFDVDIGKAIAAKLGVTLRVVDFAFDGLIPALQADKFDIILAGMTITEERKKVVLFSDPYFDAGQVIVVRKGYKHFTDVAELTNEKVAVQMGTTGDLMATEVAGIVLTRFPHFTEALMELALRRVNAVVIDSSTADAYVDFNPNLEVGSPVLSAESYGAAIKKGNEELLDFVNQVLKELKTSPYEAMLEAWF